MVKKFLSSILVVIFVIGGCAPGPLAKKEFLMNTEVEIILPQGSEADFAAAFNEMRRIEKLMDVHNPGSEISRVNRLACKETVKVNREVFEVLKRALEYGRLTSGAFDVSIRPLSILWGERAKLKEMPAPEEIGNKKSLVDYRGIVLNGRNKAVRFEREGMVLDLGGIAKGYAVDCALKILKERGVEEALINAGGDIRVMGERDWKVGLQHPREEEEILAIIRLKNRAIATSGDYQRFFIRGGKRYHHIIDPLNGYPAGKCMSVSIIAPGAMQADALATGIFILGPKKGMELIESLVNIEGIIVDIQGGILLSSGLRGRLRIARYI